MNWKEIVKGPYQDREKAMKKVKGKIDYLLNRNFNEKNAYSKEDAKRLNSILQERVTNELLEKFGDIELDVELEYRDGKYMVDIFMRGLGEGRYRNEPVTTYYEFDFRGRDKARAKKRQAFTHNDR